MLGERTSPIFLAFDLTTPEPRVNAGGGPRPKGAERHLAFHLEPDEADGQAAAGGEPLPRGPGRHLTFTLEPDPDVEARVGGEPRPIGGDRPFAFPVKNEVSRGGERVYAFPLDIGEPKPKPLFPVRPSPFGGLVSRPGPPLMPHGSSGLSALPPEVTDAELFESRTIRFHQPLPGTMKLLPGRLEVVEGDNIQSEIRFVDFPGEPVEVTFGRSPGQPLRHVQLTSPTISRSHARMTRQGKDWVICNLSRTNPIVVNGSPLLEPEEQRVLSDSDRIEMGELVFRYHAT
jgi:hypothetical protein